MTLCDILAIDASDHVCDNDVLLIFEASHCAGVEQLVTELASIKVSS